MVWWLNQLRWTPRWTERPSERHPRDYQSAFLELAVDFEAATGITLKDSGGQALTWNQKGLRVAAMMRTIARLHTIELDGARQSFAQAYMTNPSVGVFVPLGGPRVPGLGRRPQWVAKHTAAVAAANAWKAAAEAAGGERDPRARRQTFAENWKLERTGCPEAPKWKSRAEEELQTIVKGKIDEPASAGTPPRPPCGRDLAAPTQREGGGASNSMTVESGHDPAGRGETGASTSSGATTNERPVARIMQGSSHDRELQSVHDLRLIVMERRAKREADATTQVAVRPCDQAERKVNEPPVAAMQGVDSRANGEGGACYFGHAGAMNKWRLVPQNHQWRGALAGSVLCAKCHVAMTIDFKRNKETCRVR